MVISHTNDFIFLRIPKNASTSVATFLINNFCDPKIDKWTKINDSGKGNNNITENQIAPYKAQYQFIHMRLQEIVEQGILTEEQAILMNNIGIVRDPLDRQLSIYFFLNRGKSKNVNAFREMFKDGSHPSDPRNGILQSKYFELFGVDRAKTWWLYDDLNNEIAKFAKDRVDLPTYKTNYKPKDENLIEQYYDQKTKDAVMKYYEKDFELIDSLRNK